MSSFLEWNLTALIYIINKVFKLIYFYLLFKKKYILVLTIELYKKIIRFSKENRLMIRNVY